MEKRFLGKDVYLIAECAYSFEGDKTYLLDSIKALSNTGCVEAVKLHVLCDIDSYATPDHKVHGLLKKWMLSDKEWVEVIKFAEKSGLDVIILADDLVSLDFLKSVENMLTAIEIHAVSLNDLKMLEVVSSFKIPVMLGVGGSTIDEVKSALNYLEGRGKRDIVLMYGFQNYPTRYEYVNLEKMRKIKEMFKLPVGYADHTSWDDENQELITLAGFIAGANIIEKHFVLTKGEKRTDYEAAISAEDFCKLREKLTVISKAMGDGSLDLNPYELDYGVVGPMKKAIVAAKDMEKDEVITLDSIGFKRTKDVSPLKQMQALDLLERKAKKRIRKNELITLENTYDSAKR